MQLIRGLNNLPSFAGSVVTIGAFDGVHLGHQALLTQVLEKSKSLGLPSVVICFEPLPREFFALHQSPSRLMNFREKLEALRDMGIDVVLLIPFNEAFQAITAMAFVEDTFVKGLGLKHLTIGDDFRFGQGREGSKALLQQLAPKYGYEVADTPTVSVDNERVSSSAIRKLLEEGDFLGAEARLGRPYSMSGKVVYGRQLGRTLGFPTANINVKRHRCAMQGVYVAQLQTEDGLWHPAVANCGTRPTVDEGIRAVLEVHLLDYSGQLYGQHVKVRFMRKIRDEMKFDSLDALQTAINDDANNAKQWFLRAEAAQ